MYINSVYGWFQLFFLIVVFAVSGEKTQQAVHPITWAGSPALLMCSHKVRARQGESQGSEETCLTESPTLLTVSSPSAVTSLPFS